MQRPDSMYRNAIAALLVTFPLERQRKAVGIVADEALKAGLPWRRLLALVVHMVTDGVTRESVWDTAVDLFGTTLPNSIADYLVEEFPCDAAVAPTPPSESQTQATEQTPAEDLPAPKVETPKRSEGVKKRGGRTTSPQL